ncbi:MAG: 23S rRNA (adenine(2503)-C(2))-methyltransferase RlmN [Bacilli bacterium]|nr:23S rRNA (adenine(2503)-C(2))-methyltransferase RlmN [Bacilli bacterium]
MRNIYDLTIEELEDYFLSINEKKFKAIQLYSWLYDKKITTFDEMSDMKKIVIERLKEDFSLNNLKIIKVERDKLVNKYLFELSDGSLVESVLMRHDYGTSICVSSQVGCNMGCKFCESGRLKKVRNLESYEMVLQILEVENDIQKKITHVVIMGIGEPFDNYQNVTDFIRIINHPKGLSIGSRHITVSTSGIVPKILEFSTFPYQVNLAISLHAPNDKIRNEIMPINKVYKIKDIMDALKIYYQKTNRRITFEYIMLDGINDKDEDAQELCNLLKWSNCYVNLIPYNETNNIQYKRSKNDRILKFYDIIKKNNIGVTIRKEFGSNISAACGQLRSKKEEL